MVITIYYLQAIGLLQIRHFPLCNVNLMFLNIRQLEAFLFYFSGDTRFGRHQEKVAGCWYMSP